MPKDERPESGSVGNTDNNRRGRDIPPGGRAGSGRLSGKSQGQQGKERSAGDDDVEGYGIGGRKR